MTQVKSGAVIRGGWWCSRARIAISGVAVFMVTTACVGVTNGQGSHSFSIGASSSAHLPRGSGPPPAITRSSAAQPTPTPSALLPTTSPTTSSPRTLAQREQQLQAQTNGEQNVIVRIPAGYEAATYDQGGDIQFWRDRESSTTWQQIGQSSYPDIAQVGPPQATVQAALLRGMNNATFIVRGNFTGDASGNAVAFTSGANGWGAIKAENNGNIGPSGRPVGANRIGLSYDFDFVDGNLETKDCSIQLPIAECGKHPITKLWQWTGHDFNLA